MAIAMRYGTPGESSGGAGGSSGGGYRRDLLWTNPSPTANFGAQSISVDLSDYSWFAVELQFSTTDGIPALQEFRVDEVQKVLAIVARTLNRVGGRRVTWSASAKTLTFEGAYYNGGANNAYAIPLRIYGIKF